MDSVGSYIEKTIWETGFSYCIELSLNNWIMKCSVCHWNKIYLLENCTFLNQWDEYFLVKFNVGTLTSRHHLQSITVVSTALIKSWAIRRLWAHFFTVYMVCKQQQQKKKTLFDLCLLNKSHDALLIVDWLKLLLQNNVQKKNLHRNSGDTKVA